MVRARATMIVLLDALAGVVAPLVILARGTRVTPTPSASPWPIP